jgi:sulfoxide reductase heme-binding subunit YedZ
MPLSKNTIDRRMKPLLLVILVLPALWLALQWAFAILGEPSALGFNPIEYTNRFLGDWALRILILALAMRPLAILTGTALPIRFRRMTGLIAFSYVCLHVTNYLAVDLFFDWSAFWQDVLKRNYITLGMTAVVLLLPLAFTSTKKMVKRLGGRNWQRLHRLVYAINILAAIHFMMMVKGNQSEPKIYMGIILTLLGIRFAPVIKAGLAARRRKEA